jgi:hypothetical protein
VSREKTGEDEAEEDEESRSDRERIRMSEAGVGAPPVGSFDQFASEPEIDSEKGVRGFVRSVVPGKRRQRRSSDLEEGDMQATQQGFEANGMRGFFDKVDQIRQQLLSLKKNVDSIAELHSKTLIVISEREEHHIREQLDQLMTDTSLLVAGIRSDLKGQRKRS